jgi:hypothetical protein
MLMHLMRSLSALISQTRLPFTQVISDPSITARIRFKSRAQKGSKFQLPMVCSSNAGCAAFVDTFNL